MEDQDKNAQDVVIHVMPAALRQKEALFPVHEKPSESPPAPPAPLLIPVPIPTDTVAPPAKRSPVLLIIAIMLIVLAAGAAATVWYLSVSRQVIDTPVVEEPIVEDPAKEEPPIAEEPDEPKEPVPGTDTDSDGLTNGEELLYGTDFRAPDTDKDTFLDGNEVFHRYDPNGLAPSTLLDTGAVRVLERPEVPFTIFYPTSWTANVQGDEQKLSFRASNGVMIMVSWIIKERAMDLEEWLDARDISLTRKEETYTKEGYYALSLDDGRTVYIDGGNDFYLLTYDLGDELTIDYLQTFKMMVNSLHVITP